MLDNDKLSGAVAKVVILLGCLIVLCVAGFITAMVVASVVGTVDALTDQLAPWCIFAWGFVLYHFYQEEEG